MSVEQIIREKVNAVGSTVYITPDIVEKKLNNAVACIALNVDPSVVIAIIDTTIFSSAKEGLVFTGDALYSKSLLDKPICVYYKDIKKTEFRIEESKDEKDKVIKKKILDIYGENKKVLLHFESQYSSINGEKLSEMIDEIIKEGEDGSDYQTSLQSQKLIDMSTSIKITYIKIVSNYLHHETESINNKEYAEIINLIVRNNIDNESRFLLRQYIMNKADNEHNETLISSLKKSVDEGSLDDLKKSLMQDIIQLFRIRESSKDVVDYSNWENDSFIRDIQKLTEVSDDVIKFFFEKLESDEDIINKRKTNKDIEKTMKSLAAKAAGIGIPLATLYFSGSLWVFGGSLFLWGGLGPIAIAAGVGYLGYQGIKKLTGLDEIEDNGQREMMLQGIIRNSQKSLNFLIEDVNFVVAKLAEELQKGQNTAMMIQKLKSQLIMLSNGAAVVSARVNNAEKEAIIAKMPTNLDIRKFEELTSKPTFKKIRPKVLFGYIVSEETTSEGKIKKVYTLNFDLSLNELEEVYTILDNIGYFSMKDSGVATAKAVAKDLFNKAKDYLKEQA